MGFFERFYQIIIRIGSFLKHFLLLFIRVYWGYLFFQAGIGKLQNIAPVIEAFTQLGIPLPWISAYLVGFVETIGGLCLFFGFASRLAAIPLAITMAVALLTAHGKPTAEAFSALGTIHTNLAGFLEKFDTFTKEKAFNFLLASLAIFCFGPGKISLDALIKLFRSKKK